MMERRVWWALMVVEAVLGSGSDEADDEVEDRERESWGVVCVPVSRWKSSVGSEVVDEASSSSTPLWGWYLVGCDECGSGITETTSSSFVFRVERLEEALSKRECRASVRESIMGVTRYLLAP